MQIRKDSLYICIALGIKQLAEQPADADLAQLVERNLAKVEVAGSNLVIRSIRVKGPSFFGKMALVRLPKVISCTYKT